MIFTNQDESLKVFLPRSVLYWKTEVTFSPPRSTSTFQVWSLSWRCPWRPAAFHIATVCPEGLCVGAAENWLSGSDHINGGSCVVGAHSIACAVNSCLIDNTLGWVSNPTQRLSLFYTLSPIGFQTYSSNHFRKMLVQEAWSLGLHKQKLHR